MDFQEEDKEDSLSGFDYFFHLVAGAVECTYWCSAYERRIVVQ